MLNYLLPGLEDCFLNKNYYVFLYKYMYIISKYQLPEQLQQTRILFEVLNQGGGRREGWKGAFSTTQLRWNEHNSPGEEFGGHLDHTFNTSHQMIHRAAQNGNCKGAFWVRDNLGWWQHSTASKDGQKVNGCNKIIICDICFRTLLREGTWQLHTFILSCSRP